MAAPPRYEPIISYNNQQHQGTLNGTITGRPLFASVDLELQQDQKIVTRTQTLVYMDQSVGRETGCHNGCFISYARTCAGESCCMNTYIGPGRAGFALHIPGDLACFAVVPGGGWITARDAFVAGTHNLKISARFAGCCAAQFAGEGTFLTRVSIEKPQESQFGMFYAGGFGAITRHDLAPGQVLLVDHGLFFAAHESTRLSIARPGGCKALCFSGEGLVMRFVGPAVIFTQNRDPSIFRLLEKNQGGDQPAISGS